MRKTTYPRTHLAPKPKSFLYTPIEFRVKQAHSYPEDNAHEFERWFYDNTQPDETTGRVYLPIFWTAYWTNNGYGAKEKSRNNLQRFIDSLPRDKQYFTICQYDDGPMVDFKDLDIVVFGMSGGRIDYPIPLLCQPHGYRFDCKRDIFASFVGGDTHPIRKELVKQFAGKKDCHVSFKKLPLKEYCNLMARSVFALCPRGYGKSSFRIAEAIQYGAIPVYVSDEFVLPYNHIFCGITNTMKKDNVYDLIKSHSTLPDRMQMLYDGLEMSKNYYTYEGCKQKILAEVNK
jgi:hypothetical protein